jgi:catechol 2,3-dioxygenase-like lactoylglutathione lyase family enzyme
MAEIEQPKLELAHIGMSVSDIDAALDFWEKFLGYGPRWKTLLNRPYLGQVVGIPGVEIKGAFIDLPDGTVIELLDYQVADRKPNPDHTPNPGNVHVCIRVKDADATWKRALAAGARAVSDGPIAIDGGPNKGARAGYTRIHDGITLEILQAAPKSEPA